CSFAKRSAMLPAPASDSFSTPVHHGVLVPARAAYSHCASVGSTSSRQASISSVALGLTPSTGWRRVTPLATVANPGLYWLGLPPTKRSTWPCVISYFERKNGASATSWT